MNPLLVLLICLFSATVIFSEEDTTFEVSKDMLKEVWPQIETKAKLGVHLGVHNYVINSGNLSGVGVEAELFLMLYKTDCKLDVPLEQCKNISNVGPPIPAAVHLKRVFEKKTNIEIIDFKLLKAQNFQNNLKTIEQMLTIVWSTIEAEAGFKVHLKVKTIGSFSMESQHEKQQSVSVFAEVIKSKCNISLPFDLCENQELFEENTVPIYAVVEKNEKKSLSSSSDHLGNISPPIHLKEFEIVHN